jgi:membrane protein
LIRETIVIFRENNAGQMAGALSFYIMLSILPLTLLSVTLLGTVLGDEAVRNEIFQFLVTIAGPETAQGAQDFVLAVDGLDISPGLSMLGIGLILFSASTMFHHLRRSLNRLWGLESRYDPIRRFFVGRWFSMLFALFFEVLLIALIFIQTLMTALLSVSDRLWPTLAGTLLHLSDLMVSFGIILLFIGLVYRLLPEGALPWPVLWRGAGLTAWLLLVGQILFSTSLRYRSVATLYGAAGSLLIGLVGVYYAAHMVYIGAAFTGALLRRQTDHAEAGEAGIASDAVPPEADA